MIMPYSKNSKDIERTISFNEKVFQNIEIGKKEIEKGIESEKNGKIEQAEKSSEEETPFLKNAMPPDIRAIGSAFAPQSKLRKQVESVLSKGLDEIYLNLSAAERDEFKKQGEKTAEKISRILMSVKINMREIIKLIRKWLMLIPGVNKYFLEQEAKIKADELVKLNK